MSKTTNIGRGDGIAIPGCEYLTQLHFRVIKAGKPGDAKHAITAGLDNEIVETLRSNLGRQDKFHSPITSVSSGYTYKGRLVKTSRSKHIEITLQRSAVCCENHRFATWIKFN